MKRLSSSDSLIPICPPAPSEEGMYGRGFSPMLDDLDDDDLCSGRGGGGGEKKRRLSVDQVRALEKNFEVENKLDPERKLRLALELGLQPRQVAVWFQNRRARWKTKQLERDYAALKANYDALRLDFDALRHDNKSLVAEIEELRLKLDDDAPSAKEEAEVEPAASESEIKAELEDPPALIYSKDGSSDSDSSAVVNDNVVSSSITTTGGFAPANSSWSPFAAHEPKAHKGGGHGFGFGFGFSFQQQLMKVEEHGFLAGDEPCSSTFFYDEQPPSFAWCGPDQWNWVDGGGDNNNIGRK